MPVDKNKISKLLKDLERLKAVKDGGANAGLLFDLANKIEMAKGEKGDTPQKGVDYWTESEVNQVIKEIAKATQALIKIPKKGVDYFDGMTPRKGKDYFTDKEVEKIIKEAVKIVQSEIVIPEPQDGKTPVKGVDYFDGADGGSDTPEVIKQKLESLEDEDKLSIKAIKDLQEELDKIKKMKGTVQYVGGGSVGKHNVVAHDLSASLAGGVTRVFQMPAFWKVISVSLSSFPNILRPTVDFTSDASASTLTILSEIPDASLSAGQTMIVLYSE